jgi:hypothetical protein
MYSVDDINPMSYEEYGAIIDALTEQIREHCQRYHLQIDLVAPILRSGGIPGNIVAIKLGISQILPLQFKYEHKPTKITQLLPLPDLTALPELPRILICENNTVTGATALAAINLLKARFPQSELLYATVAKVYGGLDLTDLVSRYFFGVVTDEKFRLSDVEQVDKNVRPKITIFPWENAVEELRAINA